MDTVLRQLQKAYSTVKPMISRAIETPGNIFEGFDGKFTVIFVM
jgi:hypothetical protein